MKTLPIVVRISVPQTAFNPDAVDAEIWCVNNTEKTFSVSSRSESFTTIDEIEGNAVSHGSPDKTILLHPGASALIAEVLGWEWDGHVGIELTFQESDSELKTKKSYNLKSSSEDYYFTDSVKQGRIIPYL